VRDDRNGSALACHGPVGVAVVALVGDDCAWRFVRAGVDQGFEHWAVRGLATGQFERDGQPVMVCFQMDFRDEAAA